jgi:hypothetical protein
MLTVTKIPPRVHFISNGLPFEAKTDNMYANEGEACFFVLGKTIHNLNVGDTLEFSWGQKTITLTAVASPDNSGNQIPANVENEPIGEAIQSNYYLSTDFFIQVSQTEIVFEARKKGIDFDMTLILNTTAYTMYSNNAGVDPVINPYFAIISQVFAKANNGNHQLLGTDSMFPDLDGNSVFDPSLYIAPWFDYNFEFPAANTFINHPKAICPYFVKFAERYGEPSQTYKTATGSVFYALPGIIDNDKQLAYNANNQSWFQQLPYTRAFMSNSPADRLTDKTVPEKLWYLCYHNVTGTTTLIVDVLFADNTTGQFSYGVVNMQQFQVYEINVGYAALNIDGFINSSHPGKICHSWKVHLRCNSQIVSEEKTFTIDSRFNAYPRTFLFQNVFGFQECLRITGKAVTKHTLTREQFASAKPANFDMVQRNKFSSVNNFQENIEVSSGYFNSIESAFWAAEAFRSSSVFEIVNNLLIPIVLISDEIPIRKDGEFAYSFAFEYARAFNSVVFPATGSADDAMGDFNNDFNDDFSTL